MGGIRICSWTSQRAVFAALGAVFALVTSLCSMCVVAQEGAYVSSLSDQFSTNENGEEPDPLAIEAAVQEDDHAIAPVNMLQEASPRFGPQSNAVTDAPTGSGGVSSIVRNSTSPAVRTRRGSLASLPGSDKVLGSEGFGRSTTDAGDLVGKSGTPTAAVTQQRGPTVHEQRVRGTRFGAGTSTGSHWVPARIDLDTALSKFDSRQVESIQIVPGPYTSRLGPGFSYTDLELLRAPRYANGYEMHGVSAFDYKANGRQWFGQQSVAMGDRNWGSRFSYSHRTGEDYAAGNGQRIPSSYNSREMLLALGRDLAGNQSIEVSVLRLDQTGVEFPGYVFDMDDLVTDGYEVTHTKSAGLIADSLETSVWYNRTRFNGDAQNPSKRPFFPLLNDLDYVGTTDVDSLSTGYRQMVSWGTERDAYLFSIGHDLRFIRQELNEISSVTTQGQIQQRLTNRNSPIPESYSVNPGIFMEYSEDLGDSFTFRSGTRFDYTETDITDDAAKLAQVGLDILPASYAEIIGTNRYQQDYQHYSAYVALDRKPTKEVTYTMSLGYAERPPNLTALYAAQPVMLVLQNGLNNVTGDPRLADEKILQMDLGWKFESKPMRAGFRAFHAWAFDYITYENTGRVFDANGNIGQVNLKYVNTDLATLLGGETFAELFPDQLFSPFVNVRYVEGRDRTRNGDFATTEGSQGNASQRILGAVRGAFSNVVGADSEPLPGIAPLEARLGIRMNDTSPRKRWSVELAARMVDQQDRVATSLLESSTPGFTVWDVRTIMHPLTTNNLSVVLGVENFTDKNYREHFDFRNQNGLAVFQPGVNFYCGANLDY